MRRAKGKKGRKEREGREDTPEHVDLHRGVAVAHCVAHARSTLAQEKIESRKVSSIQFAQAQTTQHEQCACARVSVLFVLGTCEFECAC